MENVIPIADLPAFIDQAIAKVNEGVALARKRGILAELPKEIQFDVTVIQQWQSPDLVIVGTEESTGKGTSVTEQTSNRGGSSSEERTQNGDSNSNENGNSTNASYTYG